MRFSVGALKITEEATPREAVSWLGIALSFLLGFWTPYEYSVLCTYSQAHISPLTVLLSSLWFCIISKSTIQDNFFFF